MSLTLPDHWRHHLINAKSELCPGGKASFAAEYKDDATVLVAKLLVLLFGSAAEVTKLLKVVKWGAMFTRQFSLWIQSQNKAQRYKSSSFYKEKRCLLCAHFD